MTPLPSLSVLKVSGADAGKFLQAQLTAQLSDLQQPAATFAAYCSPRGQVIATLLVSPRDDYWLAVLEASLLPAVVQRLQKYILREQVKLEQLANCAVVGMEPGQQADGNEIVLVPRTLPVRYVISNSFPQANPEAIASWQRRELLLGIAWLDTASSEKYIPQMLGLDNIGAVSFNKGCYPGQEIVARARYLGQVKRRPQVLDIEGRSAPQLEASCELITATGQVAATLVYCVANSTGSFTVFAVAALDADEEIIALEQGGQRWHARRSGLKPGIGTPLS